MKKTVNGRNYSYKMLYQVRNGEVFLHTEGKTMSKWAGITVKPQRESRRRNEEKEIS